MSRCVRNGVSLLCLGLLSTQAAAGFTSYECTVLSEQQLGDGGRLVAGMDLYRGGIFHVERSTGTLLGAGLDNSSYSEKHVLSYGSKEMSFRAIWISDEVSTPGGGRHADYLQIKEWSDTAEKPFILLSGSIVLTGLCK